MIAPIATSFRCLSSSLLALYSLSPDPVRDGLQATANHISGLGGWSTAVVAFGVACELVEPIHDAVAWIKRLRGKKRDASDRKEIAEFIPIASRLRPMANRTHSEHPSWVKAFGRLGIILVVAGVLGELRYGSKLEDAHDAIHQHDLEKIAAADKKAGDAQLSAQGAAAFATSARADEKQLAATLAKSISDTKSAEKSLADEQQKTDDAQKKFLEAQRQLNQYLVSKSLPRQVRPDFTQNLKSYPAGNVGIWYKAEDPEAQIFASSVLASITEAKDSGWNPYEYRPISPSRFDGHDLISSGCAIISKYDDGVLIPGMSGSLEIVQKMLAAEAKAQGVKSDPRVAVLGVGVRCGDFIADPKLDDNEFRIVIGPRGAGPLSE